MIKKLTIKKQMIIGFLIILFCSIVLTGITFILLFNFWMKDESETIRPANYYESLIPGIKKYSDEKGDLLFKQKEQRKLEKLIPSEGIKYTIVDKDLRFIAGTFTDTLPKKPLIDLVNVKSHDKKNPNNVTYFIPLKDQDNNLNGALILNYNIAVSATSFADFLPVILLFLSPFVYFIFITFLVTNRIGKRLAEPINNLILASHRIKERDLDFTLDYQPKNEIGELVSAFEKMRRELKNSLMREWQLEAERRQYIDAISHDLRTPLTIIRGHAENLNHVLKNESMLERYIYTIELNVDRIIRLLDDLNQINEIDSYTFKLNIKEILIIKWVQSKMDEYRYLFEQKKIKANYIIDNKEEIETFYLDDHQIGRVIDNLLMNSIRFTPPSGNIDFKLHITAEFIECHVYDTGCGFKTTNYEKLFTRFFQLDSSRTESGIHSGQGLFIAKTIVEKHGGQIFANNRKDTKGAHVWFKIPNKNNIQQKALSG